MADEAGTKKRKGPPGGENRAKQFKKRREWQVPRKGIAQGKNIEAGDAGIFVTCNRKQEAKCVMEMKDLFELYAEKLHGSGVIDRDTAPDEDEDEDDIDIEAEIGAELKDMQKTQKKPLFANIRLDVQCVCFIRTRQPIEPVSFVEAICKDASETRQIRTKWARRLTPMACMGKATEAGLREAAKTALGPVFHQQDSTSKKFAIRPSIRNHSTLKRDAIIKLVATTVGPGHSVDLKNPDVHILVENICGVSVVGSEFEALRRFNLAEIQAPSAQQSAGDSTPDGPASEAKPSEK